MLTPEQVDKQIAALQQNIYRSVQTSPQPPQRPKYEQIQLMPMIIQKGFVPPPFDYKITKFKLKSHQSKETNDSLQRISKLKDPVELLAYEAVRLSRYQSNTLIKLFIDSQKQQAFFKIDRKIFNPAYGFAFPSNIQTQFSLHNISGHHERSILALSHNITKSKSYIFLSIQDQKNFKESNYRRNLLLKQGFDGSKHSGNVRLTVDTKDSVAQIFIKKVGSYLKRGQALKLPQTVIGSSISKEWKNLYLKSSLMFKKDLSQHLLKLKFIYHYNFPLNISGIKVESTFRGVAHFGTFKDHRFYSKLHYLRNQVPSVVEPFCCDYMGKMIFPILNTGVSAMIVGRLGISDGKSLGGFGFRYNLVEIWLSQMQNGLRWALSINP